MPVDPIALAPHTRARSYFILNAAAVSSAACRVSLRYFGLGQWLQGLPRSQRAEDCQHLPARLSLRTTVPRGNGAKRVCDLFNSPLRRGGIESQE